VSAPTVPAPVNRRLLALLATPILIITACSYAGSALMPALIDDRPELVLALNSVNRNLLLAIGSDVVPAAFFLIGFVRLIIPDPLYFILGHEFGAQGRAWMARQPGGVPWTITWIEKAFDKASWAAVIVMPNAVVSLLAGMHRMPFKVFISLNVIGTVGRLVLFWYLGQAFEEELHDIVDFVARYQWWLIGGFILLTMIQSGIQASRVPAPADNERDG
jgi:membrane protein DedA with SNARE-associated domain